MSPRNDTRTTGSERRGMAAERGTKAELARELARLREQLAQAEDGSRHLAEELKFRDKQLECLHAIGNLFDDSARPLELTLQEVTELLPCGFVRPSLVAARICAGSHVHQTANFLETAGSERVAILFDGEEAGFVEVAYSSAEEGLEVRDALWRGRDLITTVASKVARLLKLKRAEEHVVVYQDKLRSLASELTLTEQRERRDLAADLHDRIGQSLAFAKLKLDGLLGDARLAPDQKKVAAEVCALLPRAIKDVRTLIFELSPPSLYEDGLVPAVEWLAGSYQEQFGLQITVESERRRIPLGEDIRVMLYRAVRELLANAAKHSQARAARISFTVDDGHGLSVLVEDNGCGFDETARRTGTGFGLFSIRERLRHLGVDLVISSSPGKGTRAVLLVPLVASDGALRREPA